MNALEIDWHAEALQFCQENNVCPTEVTVGTIAKAMHNGALRGAAVMTAALTYTLTNVTSEMERRHRQNVTPESGETKILPALDNL